MTDQELRELIGVLIELDKEIQKRLDALKKRMERDGYLSTNQQETHYIA